MPKFVLLATDLALYFQMLVLVLYVRHALRTPLLRQSWRYVQRDGAAMSAAVVLVVFLLIALLDSVHFRPRLPPAPDAAPAAEIAYSTRTLSVLDVLLTGPREAREKPIPYHWRRTSFLKNPCSVKASRYVTFRASSMAAGIWSSRRNNGVAMCCAVRSMAWAAVCW